jgi:hypothetical protein
LYNRPEVAAVPSGLSPTPLIIIIIKKGINLIVAEAKIEAPLIQVLPLGTILNQLIPLSTLTIYHLVTNSSCASCHEKCIDEWRYSSTHFYLSIRWR